MSHYSKEIAKIRAEEKAGKKKQKELTKEKNLQSNYAKYIKEMEARISAMSPEERIAFAHKIANEIKLNEAKLKDNKDALINTADSEILDSILNIAGTSILGGAIGATIALSTGGDSASLALIMALCGSMISGSIEIANLDAEHKYRRPITNMKRRKALENIENLERESDALDEIKEHLNETYGIKVKVPASRLLGLDREM